eukprot:jgi/Orpsp1_1/1184761/evm.model.c7180000090885.1
MKVKFSIHIQIFRLLLVFIHYSILQKKTSKQPIEFFTIIENSLFPNRIFIKLKNKFLRRKENLSMIF